METFGWEACLRSVGSPSVGGYDPQDASRPARVVDQDIDIAFRALPNISDAAISVENRLFANRLSAIHLHTGNPRSGEATDENAVAPARERVSRVYEQSRGRDRRNPVVNRLLHAIAVG